MRFLNASVLPLNALSRNLLLGPPLFFRSLLSFDFLAVFLATLSLLFAAFFPSFPNTLGVRKRQHILVLFGGFLQKQGRKDRVLHNNTHVRKPQPA